MKHLRSAQLALVAVLALCFGFALAQGDDAEAREVVEGIVQQFVDIVSQQDAAAMAQLFTEDGGNFYEGGEFVGREAVQEDQQEGFDFGIAEISAPVTEAGLLEDTAYGAGTYVSFDPQGEILGEGNWTAIYKQEGGEWKIHRLMGTSKPMPESTMSGGGN